MTKKTAKRIIAEIKQARQEQHGEEDTESRQRHTGAQILPPPSAPMQVAREFVRQCCNSAEDLTLRYWHGGWWAWRTSHWVEIEERAMRSLLYAFTERAM